MSDYENTSQQSSPFFGHIRVSPLMFTILMGLCIALEVVLERILAVNLLTVKFNVSFLPVVIAAYLFGPLGGMLCGGIGDVIGSLLFPTGGYNPLFTLTALLVGGLFGLFLMGKFRVWKVVCAALTTVLIGTLLLNSLWISIFFSPRGLVPVMIGRLPEAGFLLTAECLLLIPLLANEKWLTAPLRR